MSKPKQCTLGELTDVLEKLDPNETTPQEYIRFQMADGLPVKAFIAKGDGKGGIIVTVTDVAQRGIHAKKAGSR
jgi:hypothetical protein